MCVDLLKWDACKAPNSSPTTFFTLIPLRKRAIIFRYYAAAFFFPSLAMVLSMKILRKLALIFLYMPMAATSPTNFSYPAVFNFGDSNSDTGGLVAGIAFPVGPPNGQTYFLKPSGRFCDGRLIIDFFST